MITFVLCMYYSECICLHGLKYLKLLKIVNHFQIVIKRS